jgi:hypothetical protein
MIAIPIIFGLLVVITTAEKCREHGGVCRRNITMELDVCGKVVHRENHLNAA